MQEYQQQAPQHSQRIKELFRRFDRIQNQIDNYIQDSNNRLRALEEVTAARGEKLDATQQIIYTLQSHLERMETGLLQEFKISQEIMRAMIEHDMSIERAKQDFKIELEKKDKELQQRQAEQELENKKARNDMQRQLFIKLGAIGAPLLIAGTTLAIKFIESFF